MREPLSRPGPSRVRGRWALSKRVRGLLLAVHRFAEHRADDAGDRRWAAVLHDELLRAVRAADAAAAEGGRDG